MYEIYMDQHPKRKQLQQYFVFNSLSCYVIVISCLSMSGCKMQVGSLYRVEIRFKIIVHFTHAVVLILKHLTSQNFYVWDDEIVLVWIDMQWVTSPVCCKQNNSFRIYILGY